MVHIKKRAEIYKGVRVDMIVNQADKLKIWEVKSPVQMTVNTNVLFMTA